MPEQHIRMEEYEDNDNAIFVIEKNPFSIS
jgi:hypothetical protein